MNTRYRFAEEVPLELVRKYNRPGPRYTSYPTAPHFDASFGPEDFTRALGRGPVNATQGDLSLYVHLPFCRSLCYYCACHMLVTHKPEKIARYLDYVKREIDLVSAHAATGRRVVQVHWGGGTPTYLAPEQIEELMAHLHRRFTIVPHAEVGLEADPRGLTEAHLQAARRAGFNRLSFGIQDFNPEVQAAINRIQPFDLVERATKVARDLGFESISYDLVYGLPHQTVQGFLETVDRVVDLAPDRLSLFSYAHVPWKKKHQQLIQDAWLPEPEEKLQILLAATERLVSRGGYRYIGMDHFARPEDSLCRAREAGTLQRNFQGYSTHGGTELFGFGLSAISQMEGVYAQNELDLRRYYAAIDANRPATLRGYELNEDDRLRRHVIMTLMCHFSLDVSQVEDRFGIDFATYFADALDQLAVMEADGLVVCTPGTIQVTERGRYFIRNVAMAFDAYLTQRSTPNSPTYSHTV